MARNYYEFSPKLLKAYEMAISLRLDESRRLTEEVKREEPQNVLVYYVENYSDFLQIFVDENYDDFQRMEPKKSERLKKLKSGNSNSPYHLYTQAEVRLQWAVARVKFEETRTAMFEVRKAFHMLEKNQRRFPDFMANKKSLGILHSVVGAVPPNMRWLVKLAGMSGTIEQGRAEIKEVVDYAASHPDFIFREETIIMYALMILHIGNASAEAWEVIRSSDLDPTTNPLVCFAQAGVAQYTGRSKEVISILSKRPEGKSYYPFHFMDYMLGLAKLYRGEEDAGYYLNHFAMHFKGRNYIKECYQRIAWYELLKGNEEGYRKNMKKVLVKGHTDVDGDKNAQRAAEAGVVPNVTLLRARMLFDGGLYGEAEYILSGYSESDFHGFDDQTELLYRKGRIAQALSKYDQAIQYYDATIGKGWRLPAYFACRAALEAGTIKEDQGQYAAAKVYYNKCLELSPDQYRTGLHAQAKAGLSRLKHMD